MLREVMMAGDIYVLIEHLQGELSELSYIMLAAGRVLADGTDGGLVGVLLGHDVDGLVTKLAADRVLVVDHPALAEYTPEAYQNALAALIEQGDPRAVLLGETSIGADVAGGLSAQLGLPQISLCRSVSADGGQLKFTCQICGGKILAEGELPGPTCLVTMVPGGYKVEAGQGTSAPPIEKADAPDLEGLRVSLKGYLEPDVGDVDIAREPILIAVGRGIQQEMNLELVEEVATALGGVVCASRPVVDQGWLATSRLVGKSGKRVSPKVYMAIGISGAPEHAEGIGDAELILAINTDNQAPIFDLANYGAAVDLFDLVPVLAEKIQQAKGG
jgi:electron transfer flavoprotein alpha subunit